MKCSAKLESFSFFYLDAIKFPKYTKMWGPKQYMISKFLPYSLLYNFNVVGFIFTGGLFPCRVCGSDRGQNPGLCPINGAPQQQ